MSGGKRSGPPRQVAGGDPALDSRAFRQCLGQYATGVTVITAATGGSLVGVTANSFASVSLNPPLVLWSIGRDSRSFQAFERATAFSINVLSSAQIDLSKRFSGSDTDKFAGVPWSPGTLGAPLLHGAVAHFECVREASHDGGDHLILVGRVKRFAQFEAEALLFAQGRYGVAEDLPEIRSTREPSAAGAAVDFAQIPFLTLMFQAYHAISGSFEEHRQAEGVTRPQVRVLTGLSETPGLTLEGLHRTKFLSKRDAEDAVAFLLERNYVAADSTGRLRLSVAGVGLINAINQRWAAFENKQLDGISADDIAFARRFFEELIQREGEYRS